MKFIKLVRRLKLFISNLSRDYILKSDFKRFGANSRLEYPCHIESPRMVTVEENVNIRYGLQVLNAKTEEVIIKRNSTLAPNVTIVPNNHIPTVGIPIFLLTSSHVNDKSTDIIIEEDCWVGTGSILLAGSRLSRGSIVGAGSIVTKGVPPYAVVVGSPARIVAVRFSVEQIISHEKSLYRSVDRLSLERLHQLFSGYYNGLKVIGELKELEADKSILLETLIRDRKYVKPDLYQE